MFVENAVGRPVALATYAWALTPKATASAIFPFAAVASTRA
jgi:hypothetical protein